MSDRPEEPSDYTGSRWEITNDEEATWAMRKIAGARQALDRVNRVAEAEIAHVNKWAARESEGHESTIAFFEARLFAYASEQRELFARKSVSTPWGTLRSRARSGRPVVTDREVFTEWAREKYPEAVQVKYTADLRALEGLSIAEDMDSGVMVTADGEVVPGVQYHEGGIMYRVDVGEVGEALLAFDDDDDNEEGWT